LASRMMKQAPLSSMSHGGVKRRCGRSVMTAIYVPTISATRRNGRRAEWRVGQVHLTKKSREPARSARLTHDVGRGGAGRKRFSDTQLRMHDLNAWGARLPGAERRQQILRQRG
jgi:hypothetical protein